MTATTMGRLEKRLVNGERHSQKVARHAVQLVRLADPQPGQRALDIGCGNGAATIHLARTLRLEAVGIDIDPDQIAAATDRGPDAPVRFAVADSTRLPFEDASFHIVHANKVTHHIPNWRAAITEMARVLIPGGHLIFSDLVVPAGQRFPTRRALDRLFIALGFDVVHRTGSPVHYTAALRKPVAAS
jgi:ubiquinone/menaquinone biosynthesis C-methylase UbiE